MTKRAAEFRLMLLAALGTAAVLGGCGGGGTDLPCEQNSECAEGFACDKDGVCVAVVPLEITNDSLPDATVGQNYTTVITAGGGLSPFRYTLREAPTWLSIGNSDGVLSGRPENGDAGMVSFRVVVFDSSNHGNGQSVEKAFSLIVRECSASAECFIPEGGQCWKGVQECRDGKLLSCVKTETPSDDMAHCGEECNACSGLRANRCTGVCMCNDKTACDEGQACCNGACIDIRTDRENCGGCGIVCDAAALGVLTAFCQDGACDYDTCNQGFWDCDGDRSNGCEVGMSAENCGGCNLVCGEHASCVLYSGCTCEGGYGDCNDSQDDGCESPLDTVAHCGSCQSDCAQAVQHVTEPKCEGGSCDYTACQTQYGDCDGERPNGCEEDLWQLTACGNACQGRANCSATVQHASGVSCDQGSCDYAQCQSGYGDCDSTRPNGCETAMNQTTSCGTACGALHDCTHDVQNASGVSCASGACNYGSCNSGFGDCDSTRPNGCETNLWQTEACGTTCGNRVDCLQTVHHVLGTYCNQGSCDFTSCVPVNAYANCDGVHSNGCETPLKEVTSCGTNCLVRRDCTQTVRHATGISCATTGNCAFSACDAGYASCDNNTNNGCEALLWDDTNCRTQCGTGMNCTTLSHVQTAHCVTGTCEIQACANLYKNCNGTVSDGCETNLLNINNCGDCGVHCINNFGTTSCSLSGNTAVCNPQCAGNSANCDNNLVNGCESLETTTNCGSCGRTCSLYHANASCAGGTCYIQTCETLWGNCDNNDSNGCEHNLSNDRFNCGSCGHRCPDASPCVGGQCQY